MRTCTPALMLFRRLGPSVVGTDAELLARFAGGDQAAFAELVRRHGPMVWGVCRRMLGDDDAEDAFQAVFLILARKGHAVTGTLGGWLHGVARHTALKARSAAMKRRQKECLACRRTTAAEPSEWGATAPLLDEELAALPAMYRDAIVLCDLQGKSRRDAAAELGIPEGTLSSRLAAGRRKLADRLARRGVTPSAAVLASGMAEAARILVPHQVLASASAGTASAAAATLVQGVLQAMLVPKLTLAALAVSICLLATSGGALLVARPTPGAGDEAKREDVKPPAKDGKKERPAPPAVPKPDPSEKIPALQKLKAAEEAYRAARREAAVELEAALKRAEEAVAKTTKAMSEVGPKDRDGRQKAQEAWRKATDEANSLRSLRSRVEVPRFGAANPPPPPPETRFHARLERPGEHLAAHLALAEGSGQVVVSLEKGGPAEQAGLKVHDVLVELNGKPVPSDKLALRKLLASVKPDAAVPAVVLRQGKREEIKAWRLPEVAAAKEDTR